ncbi:hypothetical protein MTR67_031546 [Solanum verrucosum]|uniref:Integrase catalytic domain-containing protein n=1 Tax=Solanum verrucosum TaxID=315347 RepID=A0AAF0ZDY5_SOLVR|nr:hypothetical protein MTR67_031546 [Solanum verrucosum]
MTKSAHFIPVKVSYLVEDYAKLYLREIIRLHGVPLSIISDHGSQFTSQCWKSFQNGLGTGVKLSTTFQTQTDGQTEHTIQTLEYMMRARVIDFKGWFEVGEVALIGTKLVHEAMEKVQLIRKRCKTTQSWQKSYIDVRRRDLEFDVNDWVYLKILPFKGVIKFGKKGKLIPHYMGPYQILRCAERRPVVRLTGCSRVRQVVTQKGFSPLATDQRPWMAKQLVKPQMDREVVRDGGTVEPIRQSFFTTHYTGHGTLDGP